MLSADDFADKAGTTYEVLLEGGHVPLTLTAFDRLPHGLREGGAFKLTFLGPVDPVLPQASFPFRLGDEVVEIFIVPVGRDQAGTQYEAIFS